MTTNATETVVAQELDPGHAEIVRATLPLVGAHVDEITVEFYRRMFGRHPELLRTLFNRGNQAQGSQQRALAASIATFATHLVNPDLPHPSELLSRIGHKHASLGVTADRRGAGCRDRDRGCRRGVGPGVLDHGRHFDRVGA
jgi:nitric oxide dioxygenase